MSLENKRIVYGDGSGNIVISKETGLAHRLLEVFIDPAALTKRDYMDIQVGTVGVTRIPLKMRHLNLVSSPLQGGDGFGVMGLIRQLYGEEVYVEADEDEDISIMVRAEDGSGRPIAGSSIAVYETVPTGIDKTLLMRSRCEDHVIAPRMWAYALRDVVSTVKDEVLPLNQVSQMQGLPELEDGYVVPTALEYGFKALVLDTDPLQSAAVITFDATTFHLKDMTFEFFDPVGMRGIDLQVEDDATATSPTNIASIDLIERKYLSLEGYIFKGGHELTVNARIKTTTDAAGKGSEQVDAILFSLMHVVG